MEIKPLATKCASLRHVVLVAKQGSMHMDWNEVPEGIGDKVEVAVWHELIEERKTATSSEVLPQDKNMSVPPLSTFWPVNDGVGELVEYTSEVRPALFF